MLLAGFVVLASVILSTFGPSSPLFATPSSTSQEPPVPEASSPPLSPATAEAGSGPGTLALLEALEMTLARDPNLALEETRVRRAEGSLLVEAARFDTLLSSNLSRAEIEDPASETSSLETESLLTSVQASRELRTGLLLEPSLTLSQSEEEGTATAVNLGTVAFTLRQPLLRDRGREVVAAGERAASFELEAALLDLTHRVSQRLRAVTSAYWSTVAAWEDLQILRTTEESSRRFLESTRKLVEADVTPRAELVLLEADLAAKESATLAGVQGLFEARRTLAFEIGLKPAEMPALALPRDPLPVLMPDGVEIPSEADLVELAFDHRADLAAIELRLSSDRALLMAAENALKPRLDLEVTPSWTGLVEGDELDALLSSPVDNVPGVSSSVGLSFSFPLGNRSARGALLETRAGLDATHLSRELLSRDIAASVPIALDAVLQRARQVERAQRAVELFRQAVINEEKKLQAGSSTLIDVISQRDRLTAARQSLVSARLSLALALLDLRFETGTLLAGDPDRQSLRWEHFTTLPAPDEESPDRETIHEETP